MAVALLVVAQASGQSSGRGKSSEPRVRGDLASRLDPIFAKLPKGAEAAFAVVDASSGAVLYAHDADTPLKPASVQKLFVTAAALDRFGPDFRYQTRAYAHGDELWVVGAGDPALGDPRLADRDGKAIDHVFDEWAAALKARNVASLARIVLDDTIFDGEYRNPDWPRSQSDRWYQAPIGAFSLNDNCLDAGVVVRGQTVDLRLKPDLPGDMIQNTLKPGRKQHIVIKRAPDSGIFQIQGTAAKSADLDSVAAYEPTLFFAQALKRGLEKRGIALRGDIVRRGLSDGELSSAALLATYTTALPDILWRCNTFSQNMFAECLLKSLAAYEPDGRRSGTPGSWDAGESVLRTTLAKLGIDLSGATLRDGSGLSHTNAVTVTQLTRLLVQMRRHRSADVFLKSLARAGELGSMKNRYSDPALRGRLVGKTGTIEGVHTLAGYITRQDGSVVAFAMLLNGPGDPSLLVQVCKVIVAGD
jgi:serine-type D-Ala-D-Ala carboxypeptidase/endopeptidase (penicillin-binding protein 4)